MTGRPLIEVRVNVNQRFVIGPLLLKRVRSPVANPVFKRGEVHSDLDGLTSAEVLLAREDPVEGLASDPVIDLREDLAGDRRVDFVELQDCQDR